MLNCRRCFFLVMNEDLVSLYLTFLGGGVGNKFLLY